MPLNPAALKKLENGELVTDDVLNASAEQTRTETASFFTILLLDPTDIICHGFNFHLSQLGGNRVHNGITPFRVPPGKFS